MEEYVTYTDKIVDEILHKELDTKDQSVLIEERYRDNGFTLIGVRKEKRIVAERINDNRSNRVDVVIAVTLSVMSGILSYLFVKSFSSSGAAAKVFIPLVTISSLGILFFTTLNEMKEKSKIYILCNYKLMDIEKELEAEYAKAEMKKLLDDSYVGGSIFNTAIKKEDEEAGEIEETVEEETHEEDPIEIESFNFDFLDFEEEEEEEEESHETKVGAA